MKEQKPSIADLNKQTRIHRIVYVQNIIKKTFTKGRDVDKEKLTAALEMDIGVSRRTALEYIDAAVSILGCKEEDKIICKKGMKKQKSLFDVGVY